MLLIVNLIILYICVCYILSIVFQDIVYIGSLNPQHFDIAMMMLKHGKHVLCEKPLTMNLKQTTELINYARSKNLFLMEAVWSRCFPVYDVIRKEIASGSIGDIHQVTVSFGFQMPDKERVTFVIMLIDCLTSRRGEVIN